MCSPRPFSVWRPRCPRADEGRFFCHERDVGVSALPSIRVRSFGPVREIIGAGEVEVDLGDCATLRCVLRRLSAQFGESLTSALLEGGEDGEPRPRIRLLVNGRDVAGLRGVATAVGAGDVLTIYPPVSGG